MSYTDQHPAGAKPYKNKSNASVLQPYSVGQAATNLKVGQTELEVWPMEKFTYTDGEVTDHISTTETKGVDGSGNHYSDSVKSTISIKAKWLSRSSWLKFPGLVRRGEYVQIWRVGDSDQYYWEIMGTTNHLRRKDVVLFVVSNTEEEAVSELTPANSVIFEINTVDKHITLLTPDNEGEGCKYTIQLNYGDSNFSLSDDIGNSVVLDSLEHLIQLRNASDSYTRIDKHEIHHVANDRVWIKTKHFQVDTETTHMTGDSFIGDYDNGTWNGDRYAINYSSITLNGDTTVTKSLTGNGGATIRGGMTTFGELTNNGVNISSTHYHIGNLGKPVSAPQ